MKLPYILAVVAIGVAYGLVAPAQFEYALGHATLYVLLPPLLFEAAWNLNFRAIVRQWRAIVTLAGPGVLVTAAVIAGALYLVHVPLSTGLLAGAILSATDPIAVVAVFRRLKVPRTLATIVECEALFNDATAVVLYGAIIAAYAAPPSFAGLLLVGARSIGGVMGGVLLGLCLAFVTGKLLRENRRAGVQITATVLCAFVSYLLADALGMSGILAVISSGIALRYLERRWIVPSVAQEVSNFWDMAAILSNAVVFFMLGAALPLDHLARFPVFVGATVAGVVVSRFFVPMFLSPAGFPRAWLNIIRVAGLRSALPVALALALPPAVAHREAIVDATFAVALVTLAAGVPLVQYFAAAVNRRPALLGVKGPIGD